MDRRHDGVRAVLGNRRLRLVTVGLPALLAGSFEFVRHGLQSFVGMSNDIGNLITAGLALLGGLVYFHTVSSLVARLVADAEQAKTERLVFAQRQEVADDLHDHLLQAFFFLNVRLSKIIARLRAQPSGTEVAGLAVEVAEVAGTTEEVYLQLRDTIRRLNAAGEAGVDGGAAGVALERLVAAALAGSDLQSVVEADRATPALEPRRWAVAQSILLEALRNVRKHAAASRVRVWLRETPSGGAAGVEDDGRGFDAGTKAGFGLASMYRRAAAADLVLNVDSTPGQGTKIRIAWPAAEPVPADPKRDGEEAAAWHAIGS